jgi:hypothetical protein
VSTFYGIDIAKYQAGINMARVKAEGYGWVELKASTGYSGEPIDPEFSTFKHEAHTAGLPVVAYHFLYRGTVRSITTQVNTCAHAVGDKNIPIMIDHETADGTGIPSVSDAAAFARGMRAKGFKVTLWYLPHWVWQEMGSPRLPRAIGSLISSNYVGKHDFASNIYPGKKGVGWVGYGGLTPAIWQFTDAAKVAGREVDANAYEGTAAGLKTVLYGPSIKPPVPIPPPKPPTPTPTPAPPTILTLGRNPGMIVVRVDPNTMPKGQADPGWFTWDGQHLAHITVTETPKGKPAVSNALQLLAACGQKAPADITFTQFESFKAGK